MDYKIIQKYDKKYKCYTTAIWQVYPPNTPEKIKSLRPVVIGDGSTQSEADTRALELWDLWKKIVG